MSPWGQAQASLGSQRSVSRKLLVRATLRSLGWCLLAGSGWQPHAHRLWQQKQIFQPRGVDRLQFWPDCLLFGEKVGSIFIQWEDDTGLPSFRFMSSQFRGEVTTT